MLNTILHGTPTEAPPLIIAHGLFGSARNWGAIAKPLSDERQVVAVDLRNHGDSPWSASHSYQDLADDLAGVITATGVPADVLGHSMGGKAAMVLALRHPQLVRRLIIADIAPVSYNHSQMRYLDAMRSLDLSRISRRADAMAQLAELGVEKELQGFFLQSLDIAARRWKLNLDTLADEMATIGSFPSLDTPGINAQWPGPALFLSGGDSDYVRPEHRPVIRAFFPRARFAKLPGTGHWLHAEKPRQFSATVRAFLNFRAVLSS